MAELLPNFIVSDSTEAANIHYFVPTVEYFSCQKLPTLFPPEFVHNRIVLTLKAQVTNPAYCIVDGETTLN